MSTLHLLPRVRSTACFLGLLALWAILSYGGVVDAIFLPTPTRVFASLLSLLQERAFLVDVSVTTGRVVLGFSLSAAIAIPIGIAMANWPGIDQVIRPFMAFTRYLPVSAFIPLLILWVGIGLPQKIWIIFLGVVFHLVLLVADDAARVPTQVLDSAIMLGTSRRQLSYLVRLPHSLPAIFDDMRIMLGAAWTYLIVAELIAAESGIGKMMIESQRFLRTDRVVVGIATVGVIGLASDFAFRWIGLFVMPWTRVT